MAGDRLLRILAQLSDNGVAEPGAGRLCAVSADVTGTTGTGVMLMSGDLPQGSLCTTDAVSAHIEHLQYSLGEGPCIDAYREDRPVIEPDLAHPNSPRWPAFTEPALDAGVRAIFGFPIRMGAVRLGALNLYRDRAEALTSEQHADTLVLADIAARTVLALQTSAPPGELAAGIEAEADLQQHVHQATGMVAAQLDVSVGQALIRLKGHAFGNDRLLADVARDVLSRRIRFDAHTGEARPGH